MNDKYYFNIIKKNCVTVKSREYDSKIKCTMDFCKAINETPENVWGQLIYHHYEDRFYKEYEEVQLVLDYNK